MAIELRLSEAAFSESALEALSRANPGYRFERSAEGTVIVSPTGSATGAAEGELFAQVHAYAKRTGFGRAYPASAGFTLPDSSIVAPDATYVTTERLAALSAKERERTYYAVRLDVVFELLSSSDRRADAHAKMPRYLANGVRLGVLIEDATTTLYRAGTAPYEERSASVALGDEIPGFALDVAAIRAASA